MLMLCPITLLVGGVNKTDYILILLKPSKATKQVSFKVVLVQTISGLFFEVDTRNECWASLEAVQQ